MLLHDNIFSIISIIYKHSILLLLYCAKLRIMNWCFKIFTLPCHITVNKFYSPRESHNLFMLWVLWILIPQWSFLWTTLIAAFLVVCSILPWKMSRTDSFSAGLNDEFLSVLLNELLIKCPSDILDMTFWHVFFDNLKCVKESCWKRIFSLL